MNHDNNTAWKVIGAIIAAVVLLPALTVGGIRIVAVLRSEPTGNKMYAISCQQGRDIEKAKTAVQGLDQPGIRSLFRIMATKLTEVPPDVRPAFKTYLGKHPTLASAKAIDAYVKGCS